MRLNQVLARIGPVLDYARVTSPPRQRARAADLLPALSELGVLALLRIVRHSCVCGLGDERECACASRLGEGLFRIRLRQGLLRRPSRPSVVVREPDCPFDVLGELKAASSKADHQITVRSDAAARGGPSDDAGGVRPGTGGVGITLLRIRRGNHRERLRSGAVRPPRIHRAPLTPAAPSCRPARHSCHNRANNRANNRCRGGDAGTGRRVTSSPCQCRRRSRASLSTPTCRAEARSASCSGRS